MWWKARHEIGDRWEKPGARRRRSRVSAVASPDLRVDGVAAPPASSIATSQEMEGAVPPTSRLAAPLVAASREGEDEEPVVAPSNKGAAPLLESSAAPPLGSNAVSRMGRGAAPTKACREMVSPTSGFDYRSRGRRSR